MKLHYDNQVDMSFVTLVWAQRLTLLSRRIKKGGQNKKRKGSARKTVAQKNFCMCYNVQIKLC